MASLLKQLLITESKKDDARRMIKPMIIQGTYSQEEIEKRMMQRLNIKPATADTYYHMIVKELNLEDRGDDKEDGDANPDEEMGAVDDEPEAEMLSDIEFDDDGNVISGFEYLDDGQFAVKDNPNRRGVIRRIDGAHLIYKRKNEFGTFDELWQFNITDKMNDALDIKRDILAATDIPFRQTTSEDGLQSYSMTTMGDVQFLEIKGLPQ